MKNRYKIVFNFSLRFIAGTNIKYNNYQRFHLYIKKSLKIIIYTYLHFIAYLLYLIVPNI